MSRVLVTGHRGYIGSTLAPALAAQGFDVMGVDTGFYDDCVFIPDLGSVASARADIRHLRSADLAGFDAVVHLAALSNDPLGNLNPDWTIEINQQATIGLAKMAKSAGVRRFLFSSSCIMYGLSDLHTVDETSALDPQTAYAQSKMRGEAGLLALASDDFSPVILRNGTVYGVSPRMRFDTVLNNLMGSALTMGRVVVFSDGTPWRPVIHLQDIVHAFVTLLRAPREVVHGQVFNVGANFMNVRIGHLAELVAQVVPRCTVECRADPDADQRTYRTDFGKIGRTVADFRPAWTVEDGVEDLYRALARRGLTRNEFSSPQFTRVRWIQHLLQSGRLDDKLQWRGTSRD